MGEIGYQHYGPWIHSAEADYNHDAVDDFHVACNAADDESDCIRPRSLSGQWFMEGRLEQITRLSLMFRINPYSVFTQSKSVLSQSRYN